MFVVPRFSKSSSTPLSQVNAEANIEPVRPLISNIFCLYKDENIAFYLFDTYVCSVVQTIRLLLPVMLEEGPDLSVCFFYCRIFLLLSCKSSAFSCYSLLL